MSHTRLHIVRSADDEQWDDPTGVEDYHQPFRVPGLDEATRALAVQATKDAIAAFEKQSAWQTFIAKARFAVYWASYKPRLLMATWFTRAWCKLTGRDSRVVSAKVWHRLGI